MNLLGGGSQWTRIVKETSVVLGGRKWSHNRGEYSGRLKEALIMIGQGTKDSNYIEMTLVPLSVA